MNIVMHGQDADDLMDKIKDSKDFTENEAKKFAKLKVSVSLDMLEFVQFHRAIAAMFKGANVMEQLTDTPVSAELSAMYDEISDIENVTIRALKAVKE